MSEFDRDVIRIATRTSQLAMWQANHVSDLLRAAVSDCEIELVDVSTVGDRDRFSTLASMGGQGVFTREVQFAVLDGRADLAVHSLKDLPTEAAEGLALAAVPERASVHDALILPISHEGTAEGAELLQSLVPGSRIGTGSLRRQAQIRFARKDVELLDIRGNVETRLRKLDEGEFDAIVLAEAGLRRLGLADRISGLLTPPLMLHAVGQGALGIECRADDDSLIAVLGQISCGPVMAAVTAERSLLRELRAGCHAPVGVRSQVEDSGAVQLEGVVLTPDGERRIAAEASGTADGAAAVGIEVASQLKADGAGEILSA